MRLLVKTRMFATFAAVTFLLISVSPALAQKKATKPAPVKVEKIAPRPEDVSSVDGIVAAFYDVVSGPAGRPRQWSRDRTLYIPEVKFVSIEYRKSDGKPQARVMGHQAYVDSADAGMVREGFFEREIHRVTQTFGSVTHVFSTYEARQSADGAVIARGINSIELFYDGNRWWIAAAQWEDETPAHPVPKEFLP
jgi:hypothetical protein